MLDRRSHDGPPREVEPSTAGAAAGRDLEEWEEEVGRRFVEWAAQHRLFTRFAHDDRVPIALALAFKAGYEAGESKVTA